ncbi:hypothetical protein H310_13342 [Aphanomyces invadans]|uniref:FCP1 homology domain-containing protein n=1 Tax=Aphanomyces invadans TaxID=157072 RepID=A0A024TFB7_9STRA|nr:hypothetical protein H310_13342 [Aphanomyces invadans]ETV92281.1 hypothetical protein H310_13342 [Aphanomyces invadans]|eukprot:XP_008879032.1 hypothetical protein H310_13342 [Aphanomyces invadans]
MATFLSTSPGTGTHDVASPHHKITLLFVRMMDLLHSHPELHHVAPDEALMDRVQAAISSHAVSYQQSRHVILIMCPSPPDLVVSYASYQAAFLAGLPRHIVVVADVFAYYDSPSPYYDPVSDKTLHNPYTTAMSHLLALVGTRHICRVFRAIAKVIVVDCDNTLWSGAVSEDGVDGITITPSHAALQAYLVEQFARGVLICICSRNVLDDVRAAFVARRMDMVLQWDEHVLLAQVNHRPKSSNVRAMVHKLNVGMNSVVFLDDSAVECKDVAENCPGVTVVHVPVPLPLNFPSTCWALDAPLGTPASAVVTAEDENRTAMYRAQLRLTRNPPPMSPRLPTSADTTTSSLQLSLGMHIDMQLVDRTKTPTSILSRLVQLCQRTNQFNCNTTAARKFSSEADVLAYDGAILYVHVTDRFGHYGLVGMLMWRDRPTDATAAIDVFLLSCRVLNRGIEHAMLQHVADTSGAQVNTLFVVFEDTARNVPAKTFLEHVHGVCKEERGYSMPRSTVLALHTQPIVTTTISRSTTAASTGPRGVPTRHFSTVADFSAFFSRVCPTPAPIPTVGNVPEAACKFRRQQREAVKMLHQATEAAAIPIWTTNNMADRQPCPQCRVHTVARASACSFERCRSCCYNIQKWLHRAHDHPHPTAHAAALKQLQLAQVDATSMSMRCCQVHRNPRRANDK